jgi:response regulator of citrate/malate metabolism
MDPSRPINLLFVDDDSAYMAIARHLLSKFPGFHFNLTWKQDASSALVFLAGNTNCDLVIVDYYLPDMNGLQLTQKIRERKIETPIVFLTSNRDFRLAIEVMKYGVEDYLIKDETVDSVLPRSIVNTLERVELKRRVAEEQKADLIARKRTDAIKELVVTVCHEFNNPLAAIKISTDILLRQTLNDDETRMVHEIDSNIVLVEREISRLRDMNFEKPEFPLT